MTQTNDLFARYPSLQDRSVFITGSGIGASSVAAFCNPGARVVFENGGRS